MAAHADGQRLPEEELAAISPDDGWFVFAVVRHPTARLFSAWQSKLLLREPWWVEQLRGRGLVPADPRAGGDDSSRTSSASSVARAPGDAPLMRNRHFAPQRRLLAPTA